MRIEEAEVFTSHQAFHEDIRNGNSREDVVSFTTIVTVVGTKFYEFVEVFVPNIERYGSAAFTFAKLVYGYGCIVVKTNPRDNAAGGIFVTANITV